jgi:hypothetical protein
MNFARLLVSGAAVAALAGCSTLVAPPYSPDYPALDSLKKVPLQKVAVGPVQPRDAAAAVNRISLRGAHMVGPKGTFAQYLEDALVQDLREVSAYDPAAGLRLDATLLKNDLDISGVSTGKGEMQVEITISRGAAAVLKKTYGATTSFESSFAGNVAIPKGQLEYANLVRALLAKVYADADFINALKK